MARRITRSKPGLAFIAIVALAASVLGGLAASPAAAAGDAAASSHDGSRSRSKPLCLPKKKATKRRAGRRGRRARKVVCHPEGPTGKQGPRTPKEAGIGGGSGGGADQYLPWDNGQSRWVFQGNFGFPVYGPPTHATGNTKYGWDFSGSGIFGTTVRAALPGVVHSINPQHASCPSSPRPSCNGGWGNVVTVRAADGSCARYAHLSRISVSRGQNVNRYDVIGNVGNSGASSGPHLHYQREICTTGTAPTASIPSSFIEAGAPRSNSRPISRNSPAPLVISFTAAMDAQYPSDSAGNVTLQAGGAPVELGFNVRYNQPFDVGRFVLRPVTSEAIGRFVSVRGDFPGARAPNDGAVGYYRATLGVPAGTPPGRYFLQWRATNVETGQTAIEPSLSVIVTQPPNPEGKTYPPAAPGAPPYAIRYIGQEQPKVISPGKSGVVRIRVQNAGSAGWDNNVHLASKEDRPIRFGAEGVLNGNRVAFTGEDSDPFIAPNETATFSYTVRSPAAQAGAFRQYFGLVRDGPGPRFGEELGIYVPTIVADGDHFPPELTPADCTWQYVAQTGSPITADRVDVTEVTTSRFQFTLRNTSELCPWFARGAKPLRLATRNPLDRASAFAADMSEGWLTPNRISIPADVAPGETVTIPFTLRARSGTPAGDYDERFAPVVEGRMHFADQGVFAPIRKR